MLLLGFNCGRDPAWFDVQPPRHARVNPLLLAVFLIAKSAAPFN